MPALDADADGLLAIRILDDIADSNHSYASTLMDLFVAVIDEDGEHAVSLAEELDAHGSAIKEFTVLVREAFA